MQTIVFSANYRKARLLSLLVVAATQLTLLSARGADAEIRGQFSPSDYKFAKEAACGGIFEVNLGQVALSKSSYPAVQQFAQRMVADHGKAGQNLQQIAARYGATLPSQPSAEQQKEIDRLSKYLGAKFDKEYVALMVKAHKEDEKAFKKASEKVENPELKAFAANTLLIIQEHLRMAEDLEQNLKHNIASR